MNQRKGGSLHFSELARLGSWHKANPLAKVPQIKTDQVELAFLILDQATPGQHQYTYLPSRTAVSRHGRPLG